MTIEGRCYEDLLLSRELESIFIILDGTLNMENPSCVNHPPVVLHTGDTALMQDTNSRLHPGRDCIRLNNVSDSTVTILVGRTREQTTPAKKCRSTYCTREACGFQHDEAHGGGGTPLRL